VPLRPGATFCSVAIAQFRQSKRCAGPRACFRKLLRSRRSGTVQMEVLGKHQPDQPDAVKGATLLGINLAQRLEHAHTDEVQVRRVFSRQEASSASAPRSCACDPRAAVCDVGQRGLSLHAEGGYRPPVTAKPFAPAIWGRRRITHLAGFCLALAAGLASNASGSITVHLADLEAPRRCASGKRNSHLSLALANLSARRGLPFLRAPWLLAEVASRQIGFRGCATRARPGLRIRYHHTWPSALLFASVLLSPNTTTTQNPKPGTRLPRRARQCASRSPCAGRVDEMRASGWPQTARPSTPCALHGHLAAIDGVLRRRRIGKPMAGLPGCCPQRPSCGPTLCSSDMSGPPC
jgi:hypothetical protein